MTDTHREWSDAEESSWTFTDDPYDDAWDEERARRDYAAERDYTAHRQAWVAEPCGTGYRWTRVRDLLT